MLLVLSVCAPTRSRAIRNGKASFDPLVQAIETRRADCGAYPASLDELIAAGQLPAIPSMPSYWNMLEMPVAYHASHDKSVFCLRFGYTGVFDRHATHVYYLSTNGAWLDKKHEPPDVDWEAALINGQAYQAMRSSKALQGAVSSLTHTQFEWLFIFQVEDVPGDGMAPAPDAVADSFGSRYDSSDGSTYAFLSDGSFVNEIHEVQRDECANEHRIVLKRFSRSGR